jgi:hypothetical protein
MPSRERHGGQEKSSHGKQACGLGRAGRKATKLPLRVNDWVPKLLAPWLPFRNCSAGPSLALRPQLQAAAGSQFCNSSQWVPDARWRTPV